MELFRCPDKRVDILLPTNSKRLRHVVEAIGTEVISQLPVTNIAFDGAQTRPFQLQLRDDNDPTRIGWREIVAAPGDAATVVQSANVPATDVTDANSNAIAGSAVESDSDQHITNVTETIVQSHDY